MLDETTIRGRRQSEALLGAGTPPWRAFGVKANQGSWFRGHSGSRWESRPGRMAEARPIPLLDLLGDAKVGRQSDEMRNGGGAAQ